jgi:PAS domain S-box-containing protein
VAQFGFCAQFGISNQRRLAVLEHQLYAFLGKTADAAFCVNEAGRVCFWSACAERFFGWSQKKALHNSCCALLQSRDTLGAPTLTRAFYARELSREPWGIPNFDLEVTTSCGRRMWVNLSSLLFEDSQAHQRLVAHLARDITKIRKQEELINNMLLVFKQVKTVTSNANGTGFGRPAPIAPLSDKERRILQLFWRGNEAVQIAHDEKISLQTLRNHLHHINEKLGTHNRLQAIVHAMHRNLL